METWTPVRVACVSTLQGRNHIHRVCGAHLTFLTYGLKDYHIWNHQSPIFFWVNAAWKMIKVEFKKRGTECAPECLVWSCLCFFSAGVQGHWFLLLCMFQLIQQNRLFICVFSHIMWTGTFQMTSLNSLVAFHLATFCVRMRHWTVHVGFTFLLTYWTICWKHHLKCKLVNVFKSGWHELNCWKNATYPQYLHFRNQST